MTTCVPKVIGRRRQIAPDQFIGNRVSRKADDYAVDVMSRPRCLVAAASEVGDGLGDSS